MIIKKTIFQKKPYFKKNHKYFMCNKESLSLLSNLTKNYKNYEKNSDLCSTPNLF